MTTKMKTYRDEHDQLHFMPPQPVPKSPPVGKTSDQWSDLQGRLIRLAAGELYRCVDAEKHLYEPVIVPKETGIRYDYAISIINAGLWKSLDVRTNRLEIYESRRRFSRAHIMETARLMGWKIDETQVVTAMVPPEVKG